MYALLETVKAIFHYIVLSFMLIFQYLRISVVYLFIRLYSHVFYVQGPKHNEQQCLNY